MFYSNLDTLGAVLHVDPVVFVVPEALYPEVLITV